LLVEDEDISGFLKNYGTGMFRTLNDLISPRKGDEDQVMSEDVEGDIK
jgi:hypothetical protein